MFGALCLRLGAQIFGLSSSALKGAARLTPVGKKPTAVSLFAAILILSLRFRAEVLGCRDWV